MRSVQHLMTLARKGWAHRGWYKEAGGELRLAAARLCVDSQYLIDILAVTSPRMAVRRNIRVTLRYVKDGTLPNDVTRSTRAALSHYEDTGEIRGPKTSAFAAALKGDGGAVVLDTWMARALGVPQDKLSRKGVRESAARRVRHGAHLMGIEPAEFQAAVWSATTLRHGRVNVPSITNLIEEI